MKKSIKAISMIAVLTFSLTGCAYNNTVNEVNSALVETTSNEENSTSEATEPTSEETSSTTKETTSSSTIEEKPTTSTTATSTSSTVTKPTEKPAVSSSSSSKPVSSSNKPVSSSSKPTSTTTKPVSSSSKPVSSSSKPTSTTTKPVSSTTSSSSTTTTKPTEKPTHTHNFTNATCTTPATCKICGVTKGTVANHNYKDGHCTYCGKSDPNYVAPHDCKTDGHVWGKSYTESSTENVEIVETHGVSNCGYDYTLAGRYFGESGADIDLTEHLGAVFGSGSSKVKTTGVKTITRFIHECSECGYKEVYNTEETVTPGDTWVFAIKPRSKYFPVIWYDINNIPDEVYEGIAQHDADYNR